MIGALGLPGPHQGSQKAHATAGQQLLLVGELRSSPVRLPMHKRCGVRSGAQVRISGSRKESASRRAPVRSRGAGLVRTASQSRRGRDFCRRWPNLYPPARWARRSRCRGAPAASPAVWRTLPAQAVVAAAPTDVPICQWRDYAVPMQLGGKIGGTMLDVHGCSAVALAVPGLALKTTHGTAPCCLAARLPPISCMRVRRHRFVYRASVAPPMAHRGLFALQAPRPGVHGLASVDDGGDVHNLRSPVWSRPRCRWNRLPVRAGPHITQATAAIPRSPWIARKNIQPFSRDLAVWPPGHRPRQLNAAGSPIRCAIESALVTTMDAELFVRLLTRLERRDFHAALRAAAAGNGRRLLAKPCSAVSACSDYATRTASAAGLRTFPAQRPGWVITSGPAPSPRSEQTTTVRSPRQTRPDRTTRSPSAQLCAKPQASPCVFELVCFSRPDSGSSADHAARVRMGAELCSRYRDLPRPDIIVPVPWLQVPAAVGTRGSGVPSI